MYPAYRKKNNKVNTFTERMQGCFEFSMNGKAPSSDSHVMKALGTYAYWLATKAPVGEDLPGRLYPVIPAPEKGFDLVKGKQIYAEQCTICHGGEGQGQKSAGVFVFPPLWGKDSYNWGAGMHRINTAAGFIKQNMPLGKGGSLTDDEAWHVAAYINSHERPQDPRLVDGSVEKTRKKYHEGDGVNLYGEVRQWRDAGARHQLSAGQGQVDLALPVQPRAYCCRMNVARLFRSSLLNCAKGGIGISPHLPLPPC